MAPSSWSTGVSDPTGAAAMTGRGEPNAPIKCSSALLVFTKENLVRSFVSHPRARATTPKSTATPRLRRIQIQKPGIVSWPRMPCSRRRKQDRERSLLPTRTTIIKTKFERQVPESRRPSKSIPESVPHKESKASLWRFPTRKTSQRQWRPPVCSEALTQPGQAGGSGIRPGTEIAE